MSSPFQKKFMGKSPLRDSKTEQKNTYDAEMHKVASVTDQHALDITGKYDPEYDKRTDKEYIDPDTNEPPVQMKSPLHGYVDASDMVDTSPPTAHMWTKVFDAMAGVGEKLIEKRSDPEWKAKHQEKRAGRIEERVAKRTKKGKKGYEVDITTDAGWAGLIPQINVEMGDKAAKKLSKAQELRGRAEENKILAEKNKTKAANEKLLNAYKAGNLTLDQYNQLAGGTSNTNTTNTSTTGLTFNEDGFTDEMTFEDGTKNKIKKCSTPHKQTDPEGYKALGCG